MGEDMEGGGPGGTGEGGVWRVGVGSNFRRRRFELMSSESKSLIVRSSSFSSSVQTCPTGSLNTRGTPLLQAPDRPSGADFLLPSFRHGSLGFLPRKRAARHRGKAKSFPKVRHCFACRGRARAAKFCAVRTCQLTLVSIFLRTMPRSLSTSPPSLVTRLV